MITIECLKYIFAKRPQLTEGEQKKFYDYEIKRLFVKLIMYIPHQSREILDLDDKNSFFNKEIIPLASIIKKNSLIYLFFGVRFIIFISLILFFFMQWYHCDGKLYEEKMYAGEYETIFSKENDDKIGIPFCNVLFKPKKQFLSDTLQGKISFLIWKSYLAFEFLIFNLEICLLIVKKILIARINKNDSDRVKCISFKNFTALSYFIGIIFFYFLSILFQYILIYFLDYELIDRIKLNILSNIEFIDILFGKHLLIELLLFYSIYQISNDIKYFGLFGLCFIKDTSFFFKIFNYSIVLSIIQKLITSFTDKAFLINLDVNIYRYNKTSKVHSIVPIKVSLAHLDINLRHIYKPELDAYIYDNSLIKIIFYSISLSFILFVAFVTIQCLFERFVYKSDLSLARLEQQLSLLYDFNSSFSVFSYFFLENPSQVHTLLKEYSKIKAKYNLFKREDSFGLRSFLKCLWIIVYQIFKTKHVKVIMKHYRKGTPTKKFDIKRQLDNIVHNIP